MHIALGAEAVATLSLANRKSMLKADVDRRAERARSLYLTPGDGQAMAYAAKTEEARAFLANASIGPHLALEAKRLGISTKDTASRILRNAEAWAKTSAEIEDLRLRAKAAIDAAADPESAALAAASFVWQAERPGG
jgi:hypothetical protein